jgi:hypothetical protein
MVTLPISYSDHLHIWPERIFDLYDFRNKLHFSPKSQICFSNGEALHQEVYICPLTLSHDYPVYPKEHEHSKTKGNTYCITKII